MSVMKDIGTRTNRGTETELGMKLRRFLPVAFPREIKRKVDGSTGSERLYGLPSLDDCRRHFAAYLKTEIPWADVQGQPARRDTQPLIVAVTRRKSR